MKKPPQTILNLLKPIGVVVEKGHAIKGSQVTAFGVLAAPSRL